MRSRGEQHDRKDIPTDGVVGLSDEEVRVIRLAMRRQAGQVRSPSALEAERITLGQRLADAVTGMMGSWRFIIAQSAILLGWIVVNVTGWIHGWDPYPFILLNLALSFQAAYAAPIIMMSQNRMAAKDRLNAEYDFEIDVRAELEIAEIQARFDELAGRQWDALVDLQRQQLELLQRIEALSRDVHRITTQRGDRGGARP